jgi:Putative peptidoglycan binding domain
MAKLTGSVGKKGDNDAADVKQVQQLLAKFADMPDAKALDIKADGKCGKGTEEAIALFQKLVVGMRPDGLVEADGKTWKALNGSVPKPKPEKDAKAAGGGDPKKLSGAAWWRSNQGRFPNSDKVSDLAGSFQSNVKAFIAALKAAGASISVSSTLRNPERAWLMHYSWQVSRGKVKPDAVPANSKVAIVWDHGDDKASIAGAKAMSDLFSLAFKPSLTSRHIEGKAIDMDISWKGKLEVAGKGGKKVSIGSPNNGADNDDLHKLGADYGVIKLATDPPHWSTDGH